MMSIPPSPTFTDTPEVVEESLATSTPVVETTDDGKTVVADEIDDVIELGNYEITADPGVDIAQVVIEYDQMNTTAPLVLNVDFSDDSAAEKAYSQFSVDIFLDLDGVTQRSYEYDIRDGSETLVLFDAESGQNIPTTAEVSLEPVISNGVAISQFWLHMPLEELTPFNEIYVIAANRLTSDADRHRDEALLQLNEIIPAQE